jgi:O-methyltransferase involved in polyketide biosynthesis
VESRRADRLFADPLADALAGEGGFRLMELWRLPDMPRENPTIGPRTRFYDDLVIEDVADGLGQVVLVAAGMDTRAFRLPLPAEVVVSSLTCPSCSRRSRRSSTESTPRLTAIAPRFQPTSRRTIGHVH